MLPYGLCNHCVEIVEALPGVVDLRVTPEHVPLLIHETGRVELAAYIHAYYQGMIPQSFAVFPSVWYTVYCAWRLFLLLRCFCCPLKHALNRE